MRTTVLLLTLLFLGACSSIRVYSDFDRNVDFSGYETFAYFKPEIDKVDISRPLKFI